ncbi:BQ2448_6845 [Microbotryum intermedium]|uniref:BQ2448_6845 protein n=1 Tax=Microbotryum intermedium TaxID=269621 RepID=A0A238FQZ3_9BASI|nr:BQ2448_6845 [Microbotryum intermedium]
MWPFSSSSSSSTPSSAPAAGSPGSIPDRSARQACWDHRDAYFGCLEKNNIIVPGSERESGLCQAEREGYEGRCAQSWVDYFNKRRVLQLRQDRMNAQSAQQMKT